MRTVLAAIATICLGIPTFLVGNEVRLIANPSPRVIAAGDSVVFTATVFIDSIDPFGNHHEITRPEYNSQVTWQVVGPPDPLNPGLRYGGGPSATNTFYGRRAYQDYTVIATYVDQYGNVQSAEMVVTVTPGPAHHIVIEASADSTGKLWSDSPRNLLTLGPNVQSSNAFYAIVRDRYQNWIGPAYPANWTSANTSIVTVASGPQPTRGQGEIARVAQNATSTTITARYISPATGVTLADDMEVRLERAYYTEIRIGTRLDNSFTQVLTVEMETIDDTTLWVQGRRSDNGQWEYLDATWATEGVACDPSSGSGSSWTFTPVQPGVGWVIATTTATSDGSPMSDSIRLVVTPSTMATPAVSAQTLGRCAMLRAGNVRIPVPTGARVAFVDVFDLRGRCIRSSTVCLSGSQRYKGADLLAGRGAACCIVRVRFDGRDSSDSMVRRLARAEQ
jgi:hypothetical protein